MKQRPRIYYTEEQKAMMWDRGSELAEHKRFTLATDIKVFFCDPQNPWQRGSNENTNGHLRQYFPKGTDLSAHSQIKLNGIFGVRVKTLVINWLLVKSRPYGLSLIFLPLLFKLMYGHT